MSKEPSHIWQYYKLLSKFTAQCNFCKKTIIYNGVDYKFLKAHMTRKHPDLYFGTLNVEAEDDTAGPLRKQSKLEDSNVFPRMSKDAEKQINETLVKMITKNLQPLSFVENEGFTDFAAALNPNYKIPSSYILASSLLKWKYEMTRSAVSVLIERAENICITIDAWTSIGNDSYISLTGHFINSEWELKSLFLSSFKTIASPTSQTLRDDILLELVKWNINTKVICVVSRNDANVVEAMKRAGLPHVGCLADTLQFVVTAALKAPKILEMIKKCNSIVEYFSTSSNASYKLKETQVQMGKKPLKLINSEPTKWNSILKMWERFVENQDPLEATFELFNNPSLQNLSLYEWETMKELIVILQPFNEITVELTGERYTTLSKVLVLIHGLQSCLTKRQQIAANKICSEVLRELITNIKIRFMNSEYNEIYAMSSFLDPRFKCLAFTDTSAFQFCREELELLLEISTDQLEDADVSADKSLDDSSNGWEKTELADNSSIWQEFDRVINSSKSVVEKYMNEDLLYRKQCPLLWWKDKSEWYPVLALLAKKYLCVVATSVPGEMLISNARQMLAERRNYLKSEHIETILFLHYNENI